MQNTASLYSQSILRGDHVRNSDSEAFDIHFYNLKLEKMSTIVKLPLIKIIYFIINIFLFSIYKLSCQSLSSKVSSPTGIHGPPGPGTDWSKFDREFQILVGSGPRFLDFFWSSTDRFWPVDHWSIGKCRQNAINISSKFV